MMYAILTINKGMNERIEVKDYNGLKVLAVNAESVDRAAQLLNEHEQDAGEKVEILGRRNEKTDIKAFDLNKVKETVQRFEESDAGKELIQLVEATDKGMNIGGEILAYLEALTLQGQTAKAVEIAYTLGKYTRQ